MMMTTLGERSTARRCESDLIWGCFCIPRFGRGLASSLLHWEAHFGWLLFWTVFGSDLWHEQDASSSSPSNVHLELVAGLSVVIIVYCICVFA